jgi:hypothetical protein
VDLMEALRASVGSGTKKPPARETAARAKGKKVAVMPGHAKAADKRRKSA